MTVALSNRSCTTLQWCTARPTAAVVGAGNRGELDSLGWARIVSAACRVATGRGFTALAVLLPNSLPAAELAQATAEGAVMGAYNNGLFRASARDERRLERLTLITSAPGASVAQAAREAAVVGESRNLCRDLVNSPPNTLTPVLLAERARELAGSSGLDCEVLDEARMGELGMDAILAVSAGSSEPARVVVLRHGDHSDGHLAVIGKGLTFDSGGLTLKPIEGMQTMKSDMAGAAAVIAGMMAIARLGLEGVSVVGYVGATENMPGSAAMRLGDVIRAHNGKSIEVVNADAEGRLVLADLLSLAQQRGASALVDFATLTGGAVVALGSAATLATGRPLSFVEEVIRAGRAGMERAWLMPIFEEYRQAMKSEIADIKNSGGREASALTAAAFLSEFVDRASWAHLDIAGTAYSREGTPYMAKGATGEGVGTIVQLARRSKR